MRTRLLFAVIVALLGIAAAAQERMIFDHDDFVDPSLHDGRLFISHIAAGGVRNYADDFRPSGRDAAVVHVANALYWSRFQFAWKHTELRAENDSPVVYSCGCAERIYFPTPPPSNATPLPPRPRAKDTLQFSWYRSSDARLRLSWSRQSIRTDVVSFTTGQRLSRLRGEEQSVALDGDTHVRIRRLSLRGALLFARTVRSGTIDDRDQTEVLYTNRFQGRAFGRILLRPSLAVGTITGRGAAGLNVVNPELELFWRDPRTRVNLRILWSPQATRSGAGGWETRHQIAVYADRTLIVKLFR